ncbi:hypothetical protein SAMN02583745_01250 [Thorsellia anophelis DSM 18579]|uniref:Uncharacterized protein n=1 Tax=Thorsellia anophelis DSM 18579 TaxID=1123402 RepID=A0A1I0BGU8_9GAMM|nr:hypothetical protein SAMN02583745_01250 [Thorsellia anophelis DSM 18579]
MICGSRQIKIYGDIIESDTDKIDANISVIMSNVLDSNASLKEINTSIKLYCVNCGYEFAFNAEVIDLWIKNNSEL